MASLRILVVDDSATMQKVVRIAFSKFDVEVQASSSVVQALGTIARSSKPALVIVDAAIGGIRSLEELQSLRTEAGSCPFLLLVGTHQKVDEELFRAKGFEFFLRKPFESTDLVLAAGKSYGKSFPAKALAPSFGDLSETQQSSATQASVPSQTRVTVSHLPPPPPSVGGASAFTVTGVPPSFRPQDSDLDRTVGSAPKNRQGEGNFSKTVMIPPPPPGATLAFDILDNTSPSQRPALPPPPAGFSMPTPPPPPPVAAFSPPSVSQEQLRIAMKEVVEEYCRKHFAPLAREVISAELKRLADEKARLLLD